jgi:hypothetical protein
MGRLIENYWECEPDRISERYWVDEAGIRQGLYESWHTNGQRVLQLRYVNGRKYGLYQCWYSNVKLYDRCEYTEFVKDNPNGMGRYWYENGKLAFVGWYENDIEIVRVEYTDRVYIVLNRDQSIESGVFLGKLISGLVEDGVEYVISYIN